MVQVTGHCASCLNQAQVVHFVGYSLRGMAAMPWALDMTKRAKLTGRGFSALRLVLLCRIKTCFWKVTMPHQQYNACIEACNACAVACNHCATSCLHETDVKMMVKCIALDMDCAQICALAVAAMARGSAHAQAICALCADICQSCGDECVKHDMAHCQQCAEACQKCAQECRKMASMA